MEVQIHGQIDLNEAATDARWHFMEEVYCTCQNR